MRVGGTAAPLASFSAEESPPIFRHHRCGSSTTIGLLHKAGLIDEFATRAETPGADLGVSVVGEVPPAVFHESKREGGDDVGRGRDDAGQGLGIKQPLIPVITSAALSARRLVLQLGAL